MIDETRRLFNLFVEKHRKAVATDTELGLCDDDSRWSRLERLSRQFWKDSDAAKETFLAELERFHNESL